MQKCEFQVFCIQKLKKCLQTNTKLDKKRLKHNKLYKYKNNTAIILLHKRFISWCRLI